MSRHFGAKIQRGWGKDTKRFERILKCIYRFEHNVGIAGGIRHKVRQHFTNNTERDSGRRYRIFYPHRYRKCTKIFGADIERLVGGWWGCRGKYGEIGTGKEHSGTVASLACL